jgi:hypothetical protein
MLAVARYKTPRHNNNDISNTTHNPPRSTPLLERILEVEYGREELNPYNYFNYFNFLNSQLEIQQCTTHYVRLLYSFRPSCR